MRSALNRSLGIACVTTFFQLSSMAQNPAIPQAQSLQPAASSGVTSTTSASEFPDISKPGKPKLDARVSLASERISEKRYAALAFPVLRPKSSSVSEKSLEKTQDRASGRIASEVNAEIRTRSWTIPPLATRKRVAGEAGAESMIRAAIAEPKISLNNPSIRFRVNPSESKLSGSLFKSPSMEALGPPTNFQATAYALRGITASGVYVRRGVIAADPRVIPIGSVVQIVTPGYSGIYTVQDTGRLIKGKIVDVWLPSTREARVFGRRSIKLHILRWGKKRRSQI
jgi:3D (Asp-Asp-Asp) domain-containing protein